MKYLFILVVALSSFWVKADDTVCTAWSETPNNSCIFGDGENGVNWTRTCGAGSTTCKPHRPAPGDQPCQADTICMGTESSDVTDPNTLQNVCTDWRPASSQNVSCPDHRQLRWVRSCTLEHLATKTCSVDQPPNIP